MGKWDIQCILVFLHHSAAERTWLLGQSQVCQQSGASGPWLLRISSCNPAVCREKPNRNRVIGSWVLYTQHTQPNSLLLYQKKDRRGKKMHLHQIRAFLWVRHSPFIAGFPPLGGERNRKVEKGIWRWRKEHEGLK